MVLQLEKTDGGYDATQPHRHNYHEIFYFVRGGGCHDIDFRTFPIGDNSIHFVNPGQVHQVRRDGGSHGFILLFEAEFLALLGMRCELPLMLHSSANPVLTPGSDDAPILLDTLRLLAGEFAAARAHREEMLASYLNIFLLQARRIHDSASTPPEGLGPGHELIDRLRGLIERHFLAVHTPAAYAAMLCVSQNHLNSTLRKVAGKTIGGLIHERIILETKRLLYHTDMSVKEIAFALNYDDPSYFGRFFRKHAGTTPHEFREQMRKKDG